LVPQLAIHSVLPLVPLTVVILKDKSHYKEPLYPDTTRAQYCM
jgi:hypothetical protein